MCQFNVSRPTLRDFSPEPQCAENEEQVRHQNENDKVVPVFEQICASQNDRAHECDEIGGGEKRAERVENPRHGLPRENESGKENAR